MGLVYNLWISLKETLKNIGVISIVSILVITIILIILIFLEKKLKIKVLNKKSKKDFYLDRLKKLDEKNPTKTLKKIDNLTIEFFKECFKIKNSKGYFELEKLFNKKNKKEIAIFCNDMNQELYSGKKPTAIKNNELISKLTRIINTNPIPPKIKKSKKQKKSIIKRIKLKRSKNI